MTTAELVNTEVPRDRWGRPMILPPNSRSKRVAYRRTTTFVGCLEDTYNLMAWKNRQVVYGMGQRKDLVLAAAAADPTDKRKLNEIADKATEHAQASASATTGTALHALTERVDRGQPLGFVPAEYAADIKAYQKATQSIEFTAIETFRVYDPWQVAGTADRIGRDNQGRLRIYDIKTGSIDYPHKMAMQLAMYARSLPYDIATDKRGKPEDGLDLHRGVIIHLPAGEGRCDLYAIDIVSGWGACRIAHQVWRWRGVKELTKLISSESEDDQEGAGKPITLNGSQREFMELACLNRAQEAETIEELREAWTHAKKYGVLTPELRALCTERSRELQPTTLRERQRMTEWEEVEVPKGAYVGWGNKPGQHVTGKVLDYNPTGGTDFYNEPCPSIAIELTETASSFNKDGERSIFDAGELVQLSAGQVSLKRALRAADPKAGDLVKITLSSIVPLKGGKTVKEFAIKIARGAGVSAKPAAAADDSDDPPF